MSDFINYIKTNLDWSTDYLTNFVAESGIMLTNYVSKIHSNLANASELRKIFRDHLLKIATVTTNAQNMSPNLSKFGDCDINKFIK